MMDGRSSVGSAAAGTFLRQATVCNLLASSSDITHEYDIDKNVHATVV